MLEETKNNGSIAEIDILNEVSQVEKQLKENRQKKTKKTEKVSFIAELINTENDLQETSSKDIIFSPPLITRYETPVISRGTINVIQGKFGSHKSRLAELFVSLMLTNGPRSGFLGFKKNVRERFTVGLIDTERNLKEELPSSIQKIRINAGYEKSSNVPTFRFTSLKHIPREHRLDAMKEWVESVRNMTNLHLFILLDVVTDCVSSFNKDGEAMELYDFLGKLCDNTNSTFLIVIHENPGTEKARGHIGTEGGNKASTIIQIGFIGNKTENSNELIRLKFLKIRSAKKPSSLYLIYCPDRKGLKEAPPELVEEVLNERVQKAPLKEIKNRLSEIIGPSIPLQEVLTLLADEFNSSEKTIKRRLDKLDGDEIVSGKVFYMKKSKGRKTILYLEAKDKYKK